MQQLLEDLPIKTIDVVIDGWLPNPLTIEYRIVQMGAGSARQLEWGISGNPHKFKLLLDIIYKEYDGDYNAYFTGVLEMFRVDFIEWYRQGFPEEWMKNYYKHFYKYIIF